MRELNRLHLNGLRAVEAAARTRSLKAAAAELGVSISAVSQQVNRTEHQLGRRLFERTPAGLVPTEFGSQFAERLTAGFRELAQAVALADASASDILTVSVAPAFASRWLVPRLSRFHARHPEIRLRIDASVRLADLEHSDIDLAIRLGEGKWGNSRSELLLEEQIFPVCAPALAARIATPDDLARLPVIADLNTMISWQRWFEAVGIEAVPLAPGPSFTDPMLCIEAAIAGQGVMLGWRLLAADALADGRLVAPFGITASSGLGYYIASSPARRTGDAARYFRQWLREEVDVTLREFEARRLCPNAAIVPAEQFGFKDGT